MDKAAEIQPENIGRRLYCRLRYTAGESNVQKALCIERCDLTAVQNFHTIFPRKLIFYG